MLSSLKKYSKHGYTFVDASNTSRTIHPCILILSADYEEQYDINIFRYCDILLTFFRCFMVAIRGVGCHCPCPVCLIPRMQQADLSLTAAFRSVKGTKKLLKKAKQKTQTEMEVLFKAKGLRNVEVCD